MKNLVIIAAVGKNGEIGFKNDLIWKIQEDLQFFRDTTAGHYMVMGNKTYESLPRHLLEGRKYLVLSRQDNSRKVVKGVETFSNIESFLSFVRNQTGQKIGETIFVIGGGIIYKALLPYCETMILTEIFATTDHADVFFPKFDKNEWSVKPGIVLTSPEGINYRRNVYTRKTLQW